MPTPEFYSRYYPETPIMQKWPFRVRSLGYNRYAPHTKVPSGKHPKDHLFTWEHGRVLPTLTLVHVVEGRGRFRSEASGTIPMPRNSVLFVFPEIRHAYVPNAKTGWHDQWLEIDATHALPLIQQCGITTEKPVKVFNAMPRLSQLFQALFDLSRIEAFGTERELAANAYNMLTHVLTLWQSNSPNAQRFEIVERMRQYLLDNLAQSISIEEASEKAGLSPPRMRVLFKEATGLSPKQFQLEARLTRAERLLTNSMLPIGTIAEQTGFESVYHFSRQFKRMRDISPQRFRLIK